MTKYIRRQHGVIEFAFTFIHSALIDLLFGQAVAQVPITSETLGKT